MAEIEGLEASEEVQATFDTGAVAMAAALDEARDDPSLREEVAAFFQVQRRLIEAQAHHLRVHWPAADRWFAEAVRQAPSLPAAYAEWGEARLARGDLDGAIAKFSLAHERGPRFADPLKGWGDALGRQGRWSEAVRRYDQALADAPAWRDLIRAHAVAARAG